MPPRPLKPSPHPPDTSSLLSPNSYDDDASSLHSALRSDQESDSDDDQLIARARSLSELRAHDETVLHDEEELEDLVQRTRKEKNRRTSKLAPIRELFGGGSISGRRSTSTGNVGGSREREREKRGLRRERKERRERKRKGLLERAEEGEDGALMFEMEEGGMKVGSDTGSSEERDEEDERVRERMRRLGTRKSAIRKKKWAVTALVSVAVLAVGILIWAKPLASAQSAAPVSKLMSNGTALFGPTTIIISLDGFRADFLRRNLTPRLSKFIAEGVAPRYMLPSFPSVTFPNHYTLATGLLPESHGIVGNTFWDPELEEEFYYTDPSRSQDPKWWGGEPFWVTAEKQGVRTAVHMWPGSEAHIGGVDPTFLDKFNGKEPLEKKVKRVLHFLDLPGREAEGDGVERAANETRPQFIAFYVPNVDADGHHFGPNSTEIRKTIGEVDGMLDTLFKGLEERNLTDIVNIIVVSDHGMATTSTERVIQLDDFMDIEKIAHKDGWPLIGLRLKNASDIMPTYEALKAKVAAMTEPNFDVYLRDLDMPARYSFTNNLRIAPLWIIPHTGWAIATKAEFDVPKSLKKGIQFQPRGLHGYDNEHPLMRAVFIARGPAFPQGKGVEVGVFRNTEVYGQVCRSLGIEAGANNATVDVFEAVGAWREEDWGVLEGDVVEADGAWSKVVKPTAAAGAGTATGAKSGTVASTTVASGPVSVSVSTSTSVTAAEEESSRPSSGSQGETEPGYTEPQGEDSEDGNGNGDSDGQKDDLFSELKDWWHWVTGTVHNLTHAITGHNGGGDQDQQKEEENS